MAIYGVMRVEKINPNDADGNSNGDPITDIFCDCCGRQLKKKVFHMSNGDVIGQDCAKSLGGGMEWRVKEQAETGKQDPILAYYLTVVKPYTQQPNGPRPLFVYSAGTARYLR